MARKKDRTLLDEAQLFGRFATGLKSFYGNSLRLEDCSRLQEVALHNREAAFLRLAELAVFQNPSSPYKKMLDWAGVEFGDLKSMVASDGIENTLEQLYEAEVFVTINQFKGREPIVRNGLEIDVSASDFDNPVLVEHFTGTTGGSRRAGVRLSVDLGAVAHDAASHGLFLKAFDLVERPLVLWRPQAPGPAGTKKALMQSLLGLPTLRWFSQNRVTPFGDPKAYIFARYLVLASRMWGSPIPIPEYTPLTDAEVVSRWISKENQRAVPLHVDTNVSSGTRLCQTAQELGLPFEGTFFRVGGEPLTQAKVAQFRRVGADVHCHYSMSEVGPIGVACSNPSGIDDVHFRNDKLGMIVKPAEVSAGLIDAFYFTTILPLCPKILLNVANGDTGLSETRNCGCPQDLVGFKHHLRQIRSYEKLSTEGMHFLGSDLCLLLEKVLPETLGGGPTDYQLVESELESGKTEVRLVISPRIGEVNDETCLKTILNFMESCAPENKMMIERLIEASTIKILRAEPYTTSSSKVLSLHQDLRREKD